jgi:hypothetical protein
MKQREIVKPSKMEDQLLTNVKLRLPELEELMEEMNSHWYYEDPIYRFYYQSFKVYNLQNETKKIVEALKSIAPEGQNFCKEFQEIIESGASGKKFEMENNENWTYHTRIFVEAFFHAKFFLEMAVKYGKELKKPPDMLPSGWAALLCLYNLW